MQLQLENHACLNKNPVISRHETKQTPYREWSWEFDRQLFHELLYLWYSQLSKLNENLCDQTVAVVVVVVLTVMLMGRWW